MKIPVLVTAALLGCACIRAQDSTRIFAGRAYPLSDRKGGRPLYTEEYRERYSGSRHVSSRTEYRGPDGKIFAERTLDFSRDRWKPDYAFKDARTGYEEGSRTDKGTLRLYYRDGRDEPLREKTLSVPEPCVVDGGFNGFIQDRWDSLARGATLAFYFAAPARLDYFAFTAQREPEAAGTVVVIRPGNAILRLLVAPIRLTYDPATHRLIEYRGLSNIADADGSNHKVRLVYPETGP